METGKTILFDFDNCWRRPFPFTETKPIFFPGGPLGYREAAPGEGVLSRRACELVHALASSPYSELANFWELTPDEARMTIEQAQRVQREGLSQAIANDPDFSPRYFDAPPWWGELPENARRQLEESTGWQYNDWYDKQQGQD